MPSKKTDGNARKKAKKADTVQEVQVVQKSWESVIKAIKRGTKWIAVLFPHGSRGPLFATGKQYVIMPAEEFPLVVNARYTAISMNAWFAIIAADTDFKTNLPPHLRMEDIHKVASFSSLLGKIDTLSAVGISIPEEVSMGVKSNNIVLTDSQFTALSVAINVGFIQNPDIPAHARYLFETAAKMITGITPDNFRIITDNPAFQAMTKLKVAIVDYNSAYTKQESVLLEQMTENLMNGTEYFKKKILTAVYKKNKINEIMKELREGSTTTQVSERLNIPVSEMMTYMQGSPFQAKYDELSNLNMHKFLIAREKPHEGTKQVIPAVKQLLQLTQMAIMKTEEFQALIKPILGDGPIDSTEEQKKTLKDLQGRVVSGVFGYVINDLSAAFTTSEEPNGEDEIAQVEEYLETEMDDLKTQDVFTILWPPPTDNPDTHGQKLYSLYSIVYKETMKQFKAACVQWTLHGTIDQLSKGQGSKHEISKMTYVSLQAAVHARIMFCASPETFNKHISDCRKHSSFKILKQETPLTGRQLITVEELRHSLAEQGFADPELTDILATCLKLFSNFIQVLRCSPNMLFRYMLFTPLDEIVELKQTNDMDEEETIRIQWWLRVVESIATALRAICPPLSIAAYDLAKALFFFMLKSVDHPASKDLGLFKRLCNTENNFPLISNDEKHNYEDDIDDSTIAPKSSIYVLIDAEGERSDLVQSVPIFKILKRKETTGENAAVIIHEEPVDTLDRYPETDFSEKFKTDCIDPYVIWLRENGTEDASVQTVVKFLTQWSRHPESDTSNKLAASSTPYGSVVNWIRVVIRNLGKRKIIVIPKKDDETSVLHDFIHKYPKIKKTNKDYDTTWLKAATMLVIPIEEGSSSIISSWITFHAPPPVPPPVNTDENGDAMEPDSTRGATEGGAEDRNSDAESLHAGGRGTGGGSDDGDDDMDEGEV